MELLEEPTTKIIIINNTIFILIVDYQTRGSQFYGCKPAGRLTFLDGLLPPWVKNIKEARL